MWLISKNIEYWVCADEFTLRDVILCSEGSSGGSHKLFIRGWSSLEEDVMWSRKQPDCILIRKSVRGWSCRGVRASLVTLKIKDVMAVIFAVFRNLQRCEGAELFEEAHESRRHDCKDISDSQQC